MNLWETLVSGLRAFRDRDPWWDRGPDSWRAQDKREQAYRRSLDELCGQGPPPGGWGPTEVALGQRGEFVGAVQSGPWAGYFIVLEAAGTPTAPASRTLTAEGRASRLPDTPVPAPALVFGYCRQHASQPASAGEDEWWFDSLPKAMAAIGHVEIDWFSPAESYDFFDDDPPRPPDFVED